MPRDLESAVITELNAEEKRPVLLFELGIGSTVRFVGAKDNLTFPTAGNVYTAKAITISGVSQELEGQIGRVTTKFDNVAQDMAAYANNEDFRGKTLIIKRVYLDALGNATYYNEVFNGVMETPSDIDQRWLTVSATIGKSLSHKSLTFAYQRMCPWIFGGTECNTNSLADLTSLTASGTADSGSTSTLVDNALTQADDYWNNGQIIITKSSRVYRRRIKDFVASSDTLIFDVELPTAVDNTCTYVIYKGCDQTLDTCESDNAWGPSADNSANFGGCIHITAEEDTE
jgi:hypothetical protein